jgi:hypothetical protein
MVPLIAGVAIQYGLRIVGLRIIPYLIREGTRIAAKQAAKKVVKSATFQPGWKRNVWTGGSEPVVAPVESVAKEAIKKVGAKKITETGYIVVVKDPKKYTLAQKIFGKNRVFKSDVLSAQSTSSKTYEYITKESLKKIKDSSIRRTIASQADDAADGVSRFILNPKSNPAVGGTKVIGPFNKFFGQNIKFTDKTLKNIKLAETGPTALGKDVVTTGVAKKAAEGVVKAPLRTGTQKFVKTPDVIAIGGKTAKTSKLRPSLKGKELATQVTTVKDAPWYVAIMPKFLRTTKEVLKRPDVGEALAGKATERIVTPAVHWGRVGTAAALGTVIPAAIGGITPEEKEAENAVRDLDYNQLFGTTGTNISEDLDVPSAIQTFSE